MEANLLEVKTVNPLVTARQQWVALGNIIYNLSFQSTEIAPTTTFTSEVQQVLLSAAGDFLDASVLIHEFSGAPPPQWGGPQGGVFWALGGSGGEYFRYPGAEDSPPQWGGLWGEFFELWGGAGGSTPPHPGRAFVHP